MTSPELIAVDLPGVRHAGLGHEPGRAPSDEAGTPVWEYPRLELVLDISYHLDYGPGVAAGFAALRS